MALSASHATRSPQPLEVPMGLALFVAGAIVGWVVGAVTMATLVVAGDADAMKARRP